MVDIPYRSGGLDGDDWEELVVLISLVALPLLYIGWDSMGS